MGTSLAALGLRGPPANVSELEDTVGVSLATLRRLRDAALELQGVDAACERPFGGGRRRAGMPLSTSDMCIEVVKPATSTWECALWQLVAPDDRGRVTLYVSHWWGMSFVQVVAAIEAACAVEGGGLGAEEERVYFCLVINNQWEADAEEIPFEQLARRFTASIRSASRVAAMGIPWHTPAILRRAWCVYELYLAAEMGKRVELCMPPEERADFVRKLQWELEKVVAHLSRVSIALAEASKARDRQEIMALVARTVGVAVLDARTVAVLRDALADVAREALRERPDDIILVDQLGVLLEMQGRLEEAEALHRRALEARERTLGEEHPDTLGSVNNLALVLEGRGRLEAAEALFRRALEARERTLGEEHPDTLTSVSNLAALLRDRGRPEEAEALRDRRPRVHE